MENVKKISKKMIILIIVIVIIVSLLAWIMADILRVLKIESVQVKPDPDSGINRGTIYALLYYISKPDKAEADDIVIDEEYLLDMLTPTCTFINNRYDCSDFSMQMLIRLQYSYANYINSISPTAGQMIKDTLVNAKYWITEPGADSQCYWSENHQLLYAAAEYLAGQMWPDEIFPNDNVTGSVHMERGLNRLNIWLEHRALYGFSEYNSANYMQFCYSPLANLLQFVDRSEVEFIERLKIITDLMVYDHASNMYNYTYMAPTSRAYASNMVGISGDRTKSFTKLFWDIDDSYLDQDGQINNWLLMAQATDEFGQPFYEVPEVLLEIGRDTETRVIKSSQGLNTSELEAEGLIGQSDEQIMFQLGMESYTNKEVFANTMEYFRRYDLFTNKTFDYFKYLDLGLLRTLNLYGPISSVLNPMPNGIALERANLYTYQTENYQLATNQAYHEGSFGASQMLSIANFTENAVVFTTHPARYPDEDGVSGYPGYWAGYGRAPYATQYENVQIQLYKLPKRSSLFELYDVPQYTHTYLPEAYFDQVIIDGRYAFAEVDGAYLALIGAGNLEYLDFNADTLVEFGNDLTNYPNKKFDLVQDTDSLYQYWIYECSDDSVETFAEFQSRIKANNLSYNNKDNISYNSNGNIFKLQYSGDFVVNGTVQDLEYDRYESAYINAERKATTYSFSFNGYTLESDYANATRSYN